MNNNNNSPMPELETGVDSGVSEDAFEQDPVLAKCQTPEEKTRWVNELTAARKERKEFDSTAVATIERYADKRKTENKDSSRYNLFFANVDTKLGALYARTPEPDVSRRYDDADDDVSRVASMLLARNISYELEQEGFSTKFKNIIWDRLVPGVGTGWIRYEQDETGEQQLLTIDPITQQEITSVIPSQITRQLADIDYVSWDDFISAPCQVWTECRWVARRIPMSREAVKARFGSTASKEILSQLSYEKEVAGKGPNDLSSKLKPKNSIQETVDVYEIWDKETHYIYWIAESADVPLDVKEDSNEFPGFFPTPITTATPLGRYTTSSTIAISDYSLIQDLYRELDNVQARASALNKALQLKWVYDSSIVELKRLYTDVPELQGVGVKDWASFNEKGGLQGAIQFVPLKEIQGVYNELLQSRDTIKNQIWEIEGIPDFMRGQTQQYDSAAATMQKGTFGTSRSGIYQRDIAAYAEALIRLKAHLMCKFYTPETLMQRAGLLPAADQPLIPQAVQLLKNDLLASFRLEVSVDSIQLPNWNLERGDRTSLVQAVGNALGQILPAAQQNPAVGQLGMHLLKFAVSGFKGSAEIEGYIDQSLQQMIQAQSQQQGQPPKPTPAEIQAQSHALRAQTDLQIAQMQEQTKQMIANLEAQLAQQEAAAEARSKAMQAQLDQSNLALKAWQTQVQAHTEAARTAIDARTAAHNQAHDISNLGGI